MAGKIDRAPPPREPTLASAPRQTPISRPLDLSGLSTVTADASLGASRYTRMKNAVTLSFFAGGRIMREDSDEGVEKMKTTLILVLAGALLGAAVASWIVPP